jgi:hypothetical protein
MVSRPRLTQKKRWPLERDGGRLALRNRKFADSEDLLPTRFKQGSRARPIRPTPDGEVLRIAHHDCSRHRATQSKPTSTWYIEAFEQTAEATTAPDLGSSFEEDLSPALLDNS